LERFWGLIIRPYGAQKPILETALLPRIGYHSCASLQHQILQSDKIKSIVAAGRGGFPFSFTGEMVDDNDLVYLRARYYHPGLGVFPSLDPVEGDIAQAMSLNRYGYVAGNVINSTDPSGLYVAPSPGTWDSCQQQNDDCSCYGTLLLSSGVFDGVDMCHYTYDPDAAVRYAKRWADDQNSLFGFFGGVGGDCTNFVSQALLHGGLPMTDAWYCANDPCGTKTGGYVSTWTGANFMEEHLRLQTGSISGVFPIPGPGSTSPSIESEIKALGANLSGAIGVGDILYIHGPLYHVALIVGWGPYVTNWDAALSQTLQSAYSDQNPIPYVVDHGPQTGIYAGPRPYYALSWSITIGDRTNIEFNDYRFVKTPRSVILPLEEVQRRAPTFTKDELLNGYR
jgi:RHS repeat-associated protein